MKVFFSFAAACAAMIASGSAHGDVVTNLIEFGANNSIGNGSLFTDTPDVANATVDGNSVDNTVGLINFTGTASVDTNTGGRVLFPQPGDFDSFLSDPTTISDIPELLDNPGATITGFTVFRSFYLGGSNALGFLEDAPSRLNNSTAGASSDDFNGSAFANSSDFILVSDAIAFDGSADDTFDIGVQAGSDSVGVFGAAGANSFDLTTFLIFDDTTAVTVDTQTITGLPDADSDGDVDRVVLEDILAGTDFSTVRVAFLTDAESGSGAGIRSLLDDVSLSVTSAAVPEPSSIAILGLIGLVAGARRRR